MILSEAGFRVQKEIVKEINMEKKAERLIKVLEDNTPPEGVYHIDTKGLKDPDQELADWIDARLAKAFPGDQVLYNELIALRDKLRAKGK